MGLNPTRPIGRTLATRIGHHVFVRTGSVIMPGCDIGHCSILGAGTVARGKIEPFSIVIGSPGTNVGVVGDYMAKRFPEAWAEIKSPLQGSRAEPA